VDIVAVISLQGRARRNALRAAAVLRRRLAQSDAARSALEPDLPQQGEVRPAPHKTRTRARP
jgi:hypothetical protein